MSKPLEILADWLDAIPDEIKQDVLFMTMAKVPRELHPKTNIEESVDGFPAWVRAQAVRTGPAHLGMTLMLSALVDHVIWISSGVEPEKRSKRTLAVADSIEAEGKQDLAQMLRDGLKSAEVREPLYEALVKSWNALRQGDLSIAAVDRWYGLNPGGERE